jgi:3-oxoacyl-[acyl-carrier protein] reductase
MEREFTNRVALVTGASRGIGAAIADALAAGGAQVIGTATSEAGAGAITERLADRGGLGAVLDVNDGERMQALLAELAAGPGAPTILVNNAGVTRDTLLLRMKDEDWDAVLDTNLRAVFRLSKACLRGMMKARFGRIVNVSSVVASLGNPGQANYCAAKAGMVGFSKAMAREVATRGITVNVVAPGFIDTDMTRELDDSQRARLLEGIPVQRLGAPEDVAAAVSFLASDKAAYVTGHTLHVNGGMYMA